MLKKQHKFTLLEILIVFCIIASLSGLIAVKSSKFISHYRESSAKQAFNDQIDLAKHLAISYQSDVELSCANVKGGIHIECLSLDEKFPTKSKTIKGIALEESSEILYFRPTGGPMPLEIGFK